MYADLDFWLALLKDDDRLADRAESLLEEHEGDFEVSLATFIGLFLVEERFPFDRERSVTAPRELATPPGVLDVVYRAPANIAGGRTRSTGSTRPSPARRSATATVPATVSTVSSVPDSTPRTWAIARGDRAAGGSKVTVMPRVTSAVGQ